MLVRANENEMDAMAKGCRFWMFLAKARPTTFEANHVCDVGSRNESVLPLEMRENHNECCTREIWNVQSCGALICYLFLPGDNPTEQILISWTRAKRGQV